MENKGCGETQKVINELEMDCIGTKNDAGIFIKEHRGVKIAFLAYTYGVDNQDEFSKEDLRYANVFNKEEAKKDLIMAKQQADFICVSIHWGEVNSTEVSSEQKDIADFLVDNGADVILGSHPSVIQPMEIRKNLKGEDVFIAYSIGNYISSNNYENSNIELILNIELRKSTENGKVYLSKVNYTPVYVLDNGEGAKNRYELIAMKEVAKEYANGNTEIISKELYDKLVNALDWIEEVIRK